MIGTDAYVAIAETVAGTAPSGGGGTTSITFSPALGAGTYAASAALTFKSQQINVKIGEGNLTYTEHRDYQLPARPRTVGHGARAQGRADGREARRRVRAHHQRHQRGRLPDGRLEGHNSAVEWVSSSPDQCEPYCIDVLVEYDPPCAPVNRETTVFPMFRAETREMNYNAATIVLSGKCMAKEPTVYRGADCDNV